MNPSRIVRSYEWYKPKTFCCAFFAASMMTMVAAATIVRFPPVIKLSSNNSKPHNNNAPNGELDTLRPRQNGRHFPDDTFKRIFMNEIVRISIKISLKFVPKGPINKIPALDQIMAWRRPGDKPLSEPMMINLPTHICVSRPQWVNEPSFSPWDL